VWAGAIGLSAAGGRAPSLKNAQQPAKTTPSVQTAAPAATDFVGDETCMGCHEAEGKALKSTFHGKAQNERTPAATGHGCETCHGNGKKHVDSGDPKDIKRFTVMAPRDANETCLSCHNNGTHVNWKGSMHDARNVSCVTCHSVHSPKGEHAQLKKASVIDTCATCHKQEVAKLQRLGHMPLREGKMECTACHNPHGSTNTRMLKIGNWVNETCVSCHTEKRGPYLWDHAPVREACNNCHDPHGSNNDRMLVAKLPMLCQRCHIGTRHPSTIYDGVQLAARSNRLIGRGCVNCHAQIHGSNSPAGNAFLR
jgi:DmsE family decaheme c-type cytochrome